MANCTPIFKKADPSNLSKYRHISRLSCIGKVMKRCVHKYLYKYFVYHNFLSSYQSVFFTGNSTTNQLVFLYNEFCKGLDEDKELRVVFCGISKAFDFVWHRGLLQKLSAVGISNSLLQWFSSYLCDRSQRVVINNSQSDWTSITAGVPQRSILGPLLFLIYINDIVQTINSNVRLFADDTSIYVIVENPQSSTDFLNSDLFNIHK